MMTLTTEQRAYLSCAVSTTGSLVETSLVLRCDEGDRLAAVWAQQGLRAARMLGVYVDDTPEVRGEGFCVSEGATISPAPPAMRAHAFVDCSPDCKYFGGGRPKCHYWEDAYRYCGRTREDKIHGHSR